MTDPSAVRPLLLPEDLFTEEDVGLLDHALVAADCVHGAIGPGHVGCTLACSRCIARKALTALATAGRLLPSAEHREEEEEFMVEGALPDGTPWVSDPHYRLGDARQLAAMLAPGAVVKRRTISAGPWVEVEGSTDV